MLNRKQFSRKLAEEKGLTYQYAETICDAVFDMLYKVLYEEEEDLSIYGFGSFKHRVTKPKQTRHPGTGEMMTVPARTFIKFNETDARKPKK